MNSTRPSNVGVRRCVSTIYTVNVKTIDELIETLVSIGLTSLYGLRLVCGERTSMDGCDEVNFVFGATACSVRDVNISDGVDPIFDPSELPDTIDYLDNLNYAHFKSRKVFYYVLGEQILVRQPIKMIVVREYIPSCPEYLKHLLEFEGYEVDLPKDEE